jgi:RNA polymerase sigma factor (sigma-70 family)
VQGDVGAFLHGVAVNVARKALTAGRIRSQHERAAGQMREAIATAAAGNEAADEVAVETWAEIEPYLDESLEQLPARQREALVMHFLEGRTQDDVATRMGLARGTVAKHVQLGLEKLRRKMARRSGVLSSAGLLTRQMTGFSSDSCCPGFLAGQAKNLSAAGIGSNTAGLAPQVVQWGEGAIRMMYWAKVKTVTSIAAACMVLTLSVAAAMDLGPGGDQPVPPIIAPGEKPNEKPVPPPGEAGRETPPTAIVVNGLKFEPVVTPSLWLLRDFPAVAQIQPTFRVTNTTPGDLYFQRLGFSIELIDEAGQPLKVRLGGMAKPGVRQAEPGDFVMIKAGETYLLEWSLGGMTGYPKFAPMHIQLNMDAQPRKPQLPPSMVGARIFQVPAPGKYTLKMHYRNELAKTTVADQTTGKPVEITVWVGEVDAPVQMVEIRRGDHDKVAIDGHNAPETPMNLTGKAG